MLHVYAIHGNGLETNIPNTMNATRHVSIHKCVSNTTGLYQVFHEHLRAKYVYYFLNRISGAIKYNDWRFLKKPNRLKMRPYEIKYNVIVFC